MDIFEKKGLTPEALNSVGDIAKEMRRLALGGGQKKEAKLSKVKDPTIRGTVLAQADNLEQAIGDGDISILALLEVARRHKEKYNELARESMVSILQDAGMSSIDLVTGEHISVSEKVEASIADKNYAMARVNMIKAEVDDGVEMPVATELIDSKFKKMLVIENPTEELKELLLDNEVEYDNKYSIHWQTLRKYCSEKMAAGKNIPEGITVFSYKEAEIK